MLSKSSALVFLIACGGSHPRATPPAPPPDVAPPAAEHFTLDPDAIAPVEPAIERQRDIGSPATRDARSISDTLRARSAAFRACFATGSETSRDRHPTYNFTIAASGAVTGTTIEGFGPEVDACLTAELRATTFAPGDGVVIVSYPFLFTSSDR